MMRRLLLAFLLFFATAAHAQDVIYYKQAPGAGFNPVPVSVANPLPTSLTSQYPTGSTAITGNNTGTTGAAVGTLTAVAGKTTYICGFNVSATGGTAAVGPITIANTITGSMVYELNSTVAGNSININFSPCIPANAAATNITTTTTADGTASAVAVNSWGFNQ